MKLFGSFSSRRDKAEKSSLSWTNLSEEGQVDQLRTLSGNTPIIIYKHSTRCGISSMVLNRLEREYDLEEGQVELYFLDLIKYRDVSNYVSRVFGIRHESPQLLLVQNAEVKYHASHGMISLEDLKEYLD